MTQLSHGSEVLENDRPELGHVLREKIRTVQRGTGRHERVIRGELGAEIYSLFHVRISGRKFTADWKIASPRSASARHADFKLCLKILSEKSPADSFKLFLQNLFNSVPNDIKEPELVAGISDLSRHGAPVFVTGSQRADIDYRNLHLKVASLA
jgi:hypothetical protein